MYTMTRWVMNARSSGTRPNTATLLEVADHIIRAMLVISGATVVIQAITSGLTAGGAP